MTDFPRPSLTLVTDRNLYRQDSLPLDEGGAAGQPSAGTAVVLSLVEAAVAGGVDIVQLRVPAAEPDDIGLYAVALRLRELTAGKASYVVTGEIELAEKCHADGILLAEILYKPADVRAYLRGGARLVGVFAQSVPEAARAERGGADYVQVGPAFDAGPSGLGILRKIKDAIQIPVVAFGGILTPEHVVECVRAGADGVAVTEAITQAPDPQAAAAALRTAMDAAWRAERRLG
ncbi:MAG: thiamine phosphate synthase [Capsulimonadaceae bacterium]